MVKLHALTIAAVLSIGCVDTALDACSRACERGGGRMGSYTREAGCVCVPVGGAK